MKLQKVDLVPKRFWMSFNIVCGNWYSEAGCPNIELRDNAKFSVHSGFTLLSQNLIVSVVYSNCKMNSPL